MGFSKEVAQKVLVATGRHCALCHKYCGTNIELHHIVPQSRGGGDGEDNCIPLCFDCHAEVEHYNPKHPRGRKFTPAELRGHRDRWFTRNATNNTSVEDELHQLSYVKLDRVTYRKLREILPSEGSISFLKTHDYGGSSFELKRHDQLKDFVYHCNIYPEFEFIDPDLEGLKADIRASAEEFLITIARNSWPVVLEPDIRSNNIPPEWKIEQPERFREIVNTVHDLSLTITDGYDSLVRLARRRLSIAD